MAAELTVIQGSNLSTVESHCADLWSSETNDQHLVLVASPRSLDDPAKVVNGPAWYPGARAFAC